MPGDPGGEGTDPAGGHVGLVRAGLNLNAAAVPEQGGVRVDAFDEPESQAGRLLRAGGASVGAPQGVPRILVAHARHGPVDVLPREDTGQGGGPQRRRGGRGPAPRAAGDHRGDVGHVGQLERARARQDRPAGHARQGGGARVAQDVRGIRGAHASQGQANVHVGAHARVDRPRGALRRGDQVQSEAAPLRRQPQEDIHRGGMRVGQDAELVDRDDQARGRGRDGPGIGLVGALPGRQVGQGELAERGLAPQEERGDPVEGARGGPRVEVRQQRLRVGQVGQARKGGPALVVDEDETHSLGRIAVGDRGEPAQERLRLARARTAGHEGVRSVRDQVEGHGSRLGSPDDDAEASDCP